ncbi:Endoribonuclease L-PSP/chorismate mutase-like protein [Echria macrotheca]|uniref:Endoribonuclease L-PSP/chorismate mutase-like protein n=1 Tax=Echria macrotheca TaxID=438768 RepID=A0AAJ0B8E7_9PEZI|nr:Endoribonuclease L-PSP/chorismate mutase-like protein [Echria macrotheca]
MAERTYISSGSPFEEQIGYSRAVVVGDMLFVSGCTGYDYKTGTLPDTIEEQTQQCLENIDAVLSKGGFDVRDIVRIRYILPDRRDFSAVWPLLRSWLDKDTLVTVRPAATMIQAGLMEEEMKIEIEVTAIRTPERGDGVYDYEDL